MRFNYKKISAVLILFLGLFVVLWIIIDTDSVELAVAKRNLILPTLLFSITALLLLGSIVSRNKKILLLTAYCLLFMLGFDLLRFGWKFTPFVANDYLFPSTKTIEFLQQQEGVFRIMMADRRILPPNFATFYRLQDVAGYDPLYLKNYGELVSAWERNEPDTSLLEFNRILSPQNYESKLADLLNVKYILSLDELSSSKLVEVFYEGQTRVYENTQVYPRAFLVSSVIQIDDKSQAINKMFEDDVDLSTQAVVYDDLNLVNLPLAKSESVRLLNYSPNSVVVETVTEGERLLVLSDVYYPEWSVLVDGVSIDIIEVDYALRGVVVPSGKHEVEFKIRI